MLLFQPDGPLFTGCVLYNEAVSGGGKAFVWYSEASARAALRLCKAALKAEREMPAWAKTATLAGWKAPKGWQP
jgi:hypothetical protein